MIKKYAFFILILLIWTNHAIAGWNGPFVVIEGQWGLADNQFGLEHGDSFDQYPTLDGIFGDGSIVISDIVNKRTVVYSTNGTFKKKEKWIEQVLETGRVRYYHEKYLLGCCVQGYDANGNLWTGGDNKYALTNKDGELLQTTTERPLELGIIREQKIAPGQYKVTVKYPDKEWVIIGKGVCQGYVRDMNGNLYCTGDKQVVRYDDKGNEIARLTMPESRFEEIPLGKGVEPMIKVIEEYGSPVVAPNGDIYTWKRTPDKYYIIKWTWQD